MVHFFYLNAGAWGNLHDILMQGYVFTKILKNFLFLTFFAAIIWGEGGGLLSFQHFFQASITFQFSTFVKDKLLRLPTIIV
jgi:hypothetical protein